MKIIVTLISVSVLLLISAGAISAGNLYVQSVKAPILSSPASGANKVAEAVRGELLIDEEKKGDWHRVKYKEVTGWISRLFVGTRPPSSRVSILEETPEKLEKGSRKRASAFATAAAARGLAEDRARTSDKYRVDYQGLEWIESVAVTDEEALLFVTQGVTR